MIQQYLRFIRKVSVNGIGRAGVVLTTSSFVTFLILELARVAGILTNTYIGLITYLLLPTMFIIGLVLIPLAGNSRRKPAGSRPKSCWTAISIKMIQVADFSAHASFKT